jgi:hypothetical protein
VYKGHDDDMFSDCQRVPPLEPAVLPCRYLYLYAIFMVAASAWCMVRTWYMVHGMVWACAWAMPCMLCGLRALGRTPVHRIL